MKVMMGTKKFFCKSCSTKSTEGSKGSSNTPFIMVLAFLYVVQTSEYRMELWLIKRFVMYLHPT